MPMTKEQKALYTAMGFTNQTVIRKPGQIDGQQFIVDSCKDCVIRIFDHCAQVTIDDCVGCEIIVVSTPANSPVACDSWLHF